MNTLRTILITALFMAAVSTVCTGPEEIAGLPEIESNAIRVFIVRHAETYHQIQKLDPDSELYYKITPDGEKQSKATGKALLGQPITACYCSETDRTRKTIQLTGLPSAKGLEIIAEKSFNRPIDGIVDDNKTSTFSWRIEQWNQGRDPQPKDGESLLQATQRCYKFIRTNKQAYGKAILIVSHGDIIAGLIGEPENTPVWDRWNKFTTASSAISVVDVYKNGKTALRAFNVKVWEEKKPAN